MKTIAPYAKAITGAVVAGLGAARLALSDEVITSAEGIDITVAFLVALGLVWAIPNGGTTTTLTGTATSTETGETALVSATLSTDPVPDEGTDADIDDGLDYTETGGRPYPSTVEDGSPDRY